MKRLLIAGAIAASLAACGGGSGPAPATPALVPIAAPGPVVFVGDSITADWGEAAYTDGHTLALLVPGSVDAGDPGDSTKQMLDRYDRDVLAHHPSVVVILGGTNDLYLYPDAATVDNIATMADRASAAGATVILGLTTPTNNWGLIRYHGARGNAAIKLWDADLRRLARAYGYGVADYYDVLVTPTGAEDATLFAPDGIHPIAAGYARMWTVIAPLLPAR
jgi:lysophospholipase L1-like esterase